MHIDKEKAEINSKERGGFIPTDADINPFEDIVCEAKINPGYGCHQKIEYRFVAKESSGEEIAIKDWSQMAYKGIDTATGLSNYIGPLSGWDDGWTDGNTLDYIIKVIKRDGKSNTIKCEVKVEDELANVENEKFFPVSLCLKLWGDRNAPHTTNFMRGESTDLHAKNLVSMTFLHIVRWGFNSIDPFKTYQKKFFHSVELDKKIDSDLNSDTPYDPRVIVLHNFQIVGESATECGKKELNYFFTEKVQREAGGYTRGGADAVLMNPSPRLGGTNFPIEIVLIHETAHAFCELDDEYIANYRDTTVVGSTNCRQEPSSFGIYGDPYSGCTYDENGPLVLELWRPSYRSIMRTTGVVDIFDPTGDYSRWSSSNFNVIGCGYCLQAIKSSNPSLTEENMNPYFDECMTLDTIKPSNNCIDSEIDCAPWETCIISEGERIGVCTPAVSQ